MFGYHQPIVTNIERTKSESKSQRYRRNDGCTGIVTNIERTKSESKSQLQIMEHTPAVNCYQYRKN